MREPEFDPRFVGWLRDGPSAPADWVLPAVEHHARRHPRRRALIARWSDAMKAVALRHPLTPAARTVVVVAALAVAVAVGGVFLSGSPGIIGGPQESSSAAPATPAPASAAPSATPNPPATPGPSPATADPASMLDEYLPAWHRGDVAWGEQWLAPDLQTVVDGPSGLVLDGRERHFQVIPGGRGYVYWEPRGDPLHAGSLWALPSVAGVWDPGSLVWAVFRLDEEGRIATQWLLARANLHGSHEGSGTYATPAPDGVVAFLDGCRDAFADRYAADISYRAALACYAPGAGAWISANDPSGAWTETYTDDEPNDAWDGPIDEWSQASESYHVVERTGDVVMLGDIAAYPFRQSGSSSCAAGIDLLELTPDREQIQGHWVFCGPDPLPPALLPPEVSGTWGVPPLDRLSVTLGPCDPSGVCGEFRLHVDEDCVYQLTYRGTQEGALAFETTKANSFGCAWSPWLHATVRIEPVADGLKVTVRDMSVTLPRAASSPAPSATPVAGG